MHSHHGHSHHAPQKPSNPQEQSRYEATRNTTLIGAVLNTFLAIAQLMGGFFSHSQALIADGVHTLSDLASDVIILIAAKMANKDADEDHPYGHGRIETLASIILGTLLCTVAISISWHAIEKLWLDKAQTIPENMALLFIVLAIVVKEGLFHYTHWVAKRIHSQMLLANAWHHRSDAISSLIVLVGVAGAIFFEIAWLDSVAAIVVAVMIFYIGAMILYESFAELIDTALEPEKVEAIRQLIADSPGVLSVHMLRTRKMAGNSFIDVHLEVSPRISVSEGHHIAECVIRSLKTNIDHVEDITVHIDAEDDELVKPSHDLPFRQTILAEIEPLLTELQLSIASEHIKLHYLNGLLHVDLLLDASLLGDKRLETLEQALYQIIGVKHVSVYHKKN